MSKGIKITLVITSLLLLSIVYFTKTTVHGGWAGKNPPVPPEHFAGPAMVGQATITYNSATDEVSFSLDVKDQGEDKSGSGTYPYDEFRLAGFPDFAYLTAEMLENYRLSSTLAAQLGEYGILQICTVNKFSNTGTIINAGVVILRVVG